MGFAKYCGIFESIIIQVTAGVIVRRGGKYAMSAIFYVSLFHFRISVKERVTE